MLPQLAVSAKILCLLMVVICGAVPSMVRSVRLFSQCSHYYVNVTDNGTVNARADSNNQPDLIFSTRGFSLDLLIYSPAQDRYLCFRGSKLVGRKMTRVQAERSDKCLFREEFVSGYNRYRLARYPGRYIGFNRGGQQLRREKSRLTEKQLSCLLFLKDAPEFDLDKHNNRVAKAPEPHWRQQPRLNSIKGPCHGIRHHHRRQRLRNCDGT